MIEWQGIVDKTAFVGAKTLMDSFNEVFGPLGMQMEF